MRGYQEKMCDLCGIRPATCHTVLQIGGARYEGDLCAECLNMHQMQASPAYSAFMSQEAVCPVCHTRLSSVVDSEYVGCSECYNVFRAQVLNNIQNMHGTRKHRGKRLRSVNKNRNVNLSDKENMLEQYHLALDEGRIEDAEEIYGLMNGGNEDER